eukprot:353195-Chlamydomonas_euryale.AAC.3
MLRFCHLRDSAASGGGGAAGASSAASGGGGGAQQQQQQQQQQGQQQQQQLLSPEMQDLLDDTPEFDYLTHIVFRCGRAVGVDGLWVWTGHRAARLCVCCVWGGACGHMRRAPAGFLCGALPAPWRLHDWAPCQPLGACTTGRFASPLTLARLGRGMRQHPARNHEPGSRSGTAWSVPANARESLQQHAYANTPRQGQDAPVPQASSRRPPTQPPTAHCYHCPHSSDCFHFIHRSRVHPRRMYENKHVPVHAPERFRVEISFSPGAAYNPLEVSPQLGPHVLDTVPRVQLNEGIAETFAHVESLLTPYATPRKVSPSIYALQVR